MKLFYEKNALKILTGIVILFFVQSYLFTDEAAIPFKSDNNLHQTYNDCAPYCMKAILIIFGDDKTSVAKIKTGMKWRMKNNYTIPAGLEDSIKKFGIEFDAINYYMRNTDEKIKGLKEYLKKKSPVIILVGYGKFQHYMTLLGYDDVSFFVYDPVLKDDKNNPSLTVDLNNEKPGNRNIIYGELVDMWNKGGMYGLYKNYAVSCHKG